MLFTRLQVILFLQLILQVSGFIAKQTYNQRFPFNQLYVEDDRKEETETAKMNPLTMASWYAVEAFGKIFGSNVSNAMILNDETCIDLARAPTSLQETFDRIQRDNDRSYFLSGEIDKLIYDDQCLFSDPFVAFKGRDRFLDNLARLGSFITNYSANMLDYEAGGTTVKTRVMVKLELNLPWKPILAWPWGVTYEIDRETLLVTEHRESWDVEPLEGVKQIFRKPTTQIK